MDRLDGLGLRQGEKVVVALEVALAADEPLATEMGLGEAEALDLRAHGPVEDEDALARRRLQGRQDLGPIVSRATLPKEGVKFLSHTYPS